ncbi:MAG: hypothetical protein K2V38_08395 [Gemmataceae bacterium]|nr:hypothetical protein [Gemmataceae bacterium]
MLKHEVRLIDPDADAIVSALTTTTAQANKRCRARLLADVPGKWQKFARAALKEPEGYEMFRGGKGGIPATQVLAAWWTDAIGRKHVVVRGRRVEHREAARLLSKKDLDARPPLFHAYPEYVCRRTVGDREEIVCACGCGAVGTPDSLSWMGPMCGPCFDRKEELGPDGLRANVPGVLYGAREPLRSVACSPDGARVAAGEGDDSVTYWDIPARTRTTMAFPDQRATDAAITSDGRHLLVGTQFLAWGGRLIVFDLTTDPPTRIDPEQDTASAVWQVHALPQPDLALVFRSVGYVGRIEVLRVPSGEQVRVANQSMGWQGAVSPDGTKFLQTGSPSVLLDVGTLGRVASLSRRIGLAVFSSNGKRIFGWNDQLLALDARTGAVLGEGGVRAGRAAGHVTALAADPEGEFVYAGSQTSRLCVFDAGTLRPRAYFDWHLGAITGLAVSADGSKLFSAGGDGCVKVWPIRDLLRDA